MTVRYINTPYIYTYRYIYIYIKGKLNVSSPGFWAQVKRKKLTFGMKLDINNHKTFRPIKQKQKRKSSNYKELQNKPLLKFKYLSNILVIFLEGT